MPKETFSHSAISKATRDQAWAALDRPTTWEGIAGVDRVVDPIIDEHGRLRGFSFETMIGGRPYRGTATPLQRVEGSTMSWSIDSSEVLGVTGVDLHDVEEGTVVTVTIEVETAGVLSALLFPVIVASLRTSLPEVVETFVAGFARDI
ncbi:MAG: SRPBCC family protein [Acidimicrobiia bacterium]